jgi:hypothetical protein
MRYSLIIGMAVTEAVAAMPEIPHDLFTMACLEIAGDPHGPDAFTIAKNGAMTIRAWVVGSMGFIRYEVDERSRVITLTNVMSGM